jgi:hypothetical protein
VLAKLDFLEVVLRCFIYALLLRSGFNVILLCFHIISACLGPKSFSSLGVISFTLPGLEGSLRA